MLVERVLLDEGARRDDPHHLPIDDTLGRSRVLHLLTDRHSMPCIDQLTDVPIDALDRNPGHRNPLTAAILRPGGEGDTE